MKRKLFLFFTLAFAFFAIGQMNAQTLMHSYTFEDGTANDVVGTLHGTVNGTMLTIADGKATVSGATAPTDGYISLDAAALALNAYSAITLELLVETGATLNGGYTMLAYFGNNTGGDKCFWYQPTRSGNESRTETNNGSATVTAALPGTEVDDGGLHHVVVVLTADALKYYLDGTLVAETATDGDFITTIDTQIANIFKGPDGWGDANFNGSLEELNIYDGEVDAATVAANAAAYMGANDPRLSDITLSLGALEPVFNELTTSYTVQVPTGTASINIAGVTMHGAATTSGDGDITLDAFPKVVDIVVTSEDAANTKTYSVTVIEALDPLLEGTIIGHESSWNDDPATYIDAAFDGDITTFVDGPSAEGYVGLDMSERILATPTAFKYVPREGRGNRMNGGELRGANNADLSDAVTLYTITEDAPYEYTLVELSNTDSYRYVYYYSADGYCNIAELEIYGTVENVCTYTAIYPDETNLVPDPECNDNTAFGGWGLTSVVTGAEAYCGTSSIMLECLVDAGCGWPDQGAALDVPFTYAPNKTYRLVVAVKTIGGSIGFLANGSDPNFGFSVDTHGEWMIVDTTFRSGPNAGTNFFSFNTCDFGSDCEIAYIDNYQLYELTGYEQANDDLGLVLIPAEDYTFYRAGSGAKAGDEWELGSDEAGFMGTGYMKSIMTAGDGDIGNAETLNAMLTYGVNFVKTGTHYIWAHVNFPDGSSDSFFYGLNGSVVERVQGSPYEVWKWDEGDASFEVSEAGFHEVNIMQREPNAMVDHIIISSDPDFDPNTNLTWDPIEVAYVTTFDNLTAEGASDPIIAMLDADENITLTVIETNQDDTDGPMDLSMYDVVVAQEAFSSSSTIYQRGQTLGMGTIPVPFILNKVYTMRDGRGFTDGAAGSGGEVEGTLYITVDPANQTNDLFNGIDFKGDSVRLFRMGGDDNGGDTRTKGLQYATDVVISEGMVYDFRDGSIINDGQSADGKLVLDGTYSLHGDTYGLDMKLGSAVKISVAGNATVKLLGSEYSSLSIKATTEGGTGTITPDSLNTKVVNDLADYLVFDYVGDAETLVFTAVADGDQDSDVYLPIIEVSMTTSSTLLASGVNDPDNASVCVNHIPAGSTIGSETLMADMIAFGMNYGAMSQNGAGLTDAGMTLWRNAIYKLAGAQVPTDKVMYGPRSMAYVTQFSNLTADGASDPLVKMFDEDPNIELTVIETNQDDTEGPMDLSSYDIVVAQEAFSSSSTIYQRGQTLGMGSIPVPFIHNKVYTMRDGRGFTDGATGSGGEVEGTHYITADAANQDNELFNGITFVGDSVQVFISGGDDNGGDTRTKGLQYAVDVVISEANTLLASGVNDPDNATVCINDIPAGATIGSETLQARMITFGMNYGAISKNGCDLTDAGLTLWRNAAYSLTGLTVPEEPVKFWEDHAIDGAVSYWRLDNQVVDDITGAMGEIVGDGATFKPGVAGNALDLSTAVDTAMVIVEETEELKAININDASLSLSLLIKFDPAGSQQEIILKGSNNHEDGGAGANGTRWEMYAKEGGIFFVIDDDTDKSQLELDMTDYPVNQWVHLVGVRDMEQDTMYFYMNGQLNAKMEDKSGNIDTDTIPLLIGNYWNKENKVRGQIDDIIIVSGAMSATEVLDLYNSYTFPASDDATLSDLQVDGATVTGFDPATTSYTVSLAEGTTTVPTVTATATDGAATVVITDATAIPGATTVDVTAADGVTMITYTVNFTIAGLGTDATLSDLAVDGTTVADFDPATTAYTMDLPSGTSSVDVTATPTDANASVDGTGSVDVSSGSGMASVVVTAEDGTTEMTYTISFTVLGVDNSKLDMIEIYPNPAKSHVNITNVPGAKVSVYAANGAKVMETISDSDVMNLDVAKLSTGVYVLKIQLDNEVKVARFIKE